MYVTYRAQPSHHLCLASCFDIGNRRASLIDGIYRRHG